jgi:UDPglucose 6-dehydrogenase
VPAEQIRREVLGPGIDNPRLTVAKTAYEAAEGAHTLAVATEWDEFKKLDYARIHASMAKPATLFDGRNLLDLPALRALGFKAFGIGK